MTERKRKRKPANDLQSPPADPWKPTDEEARVATHLYRKLPAGEGRLSGMLVRTFSAADAVELLMESSWAKQPKLSGDAGRSAQLFTNPASVVEFMNRMLAKQMFHRALVVKKSKSSAGKRSDEGKVAKSKKSTDAKASGTADLATPTETSSAALPGSSAADCEPLSAVVDITADSSRQTPPSTSSSSKSSTRPPRLELHSEQVFLAADPECVYVWIYEPPPGLFNWLAGSLLILGIISCCLFPIWPAPLRLGAYYVTLGASGLFAVLMAVALLRVLLYAACWLATMGGYSLWLFPNYFADCGFFASFRPVLQLTPLVSGSKKTKAVGGKKSRSKTVHSDPANSDDKPERIGEQVDSEVRRRNKVKPLLLQNGNNVATGSSPPVSSEDEPQAVTVADSTRLGPETVEPLCALGTSS